METLEPVKDILWYTQTHYWVLPNRTWIRSYLEASRLQQGEHALGRVQRVPPVVVGHILPVVLPNTQNPLAQVLQREPGGSSGSEPGRRRDGRRSGRSYRVLHLEVLDQVEIDEHADGSQCGFSVRQLEVAEAEVQETQ